MMIGFEFSSSAASDRAGCFLRISWLSDNDNYTHKDKYKDKETHKDKDTRKDKDKRKPPIGSEFSASAAIDWARCILCTSWFRLQGSVNQCRVNQGRVNQGRVNLDSVNQGKVG